VLFNAIIMGKWILLIAGIIAFSDIGAQWERAQVIDKKVKSATVSYWLEDSSKQIIVKTIFSVNGDDSLIYDNGELSFSFKSKFGEKGKVVRVERYDHLNRLDEIHMYEYDVNGSYTIEIIAQGAGTILFSKYDKNHKCLQQEFSGVETLFYVYNDSGYLSKMMYARKKDIPVEIAKVIVDAEGNMESIIGIGEVASTTSFKYNHLGLISEKARVVKSKDGSETKQIAYYTYELR
jgi:hypothetical protein